MDHLNAIVAFVRTAEAGSLARASKLTGMTPSGVGKSISRLEADLGIRLLNRTTRRLSLTEDGQIFFDRCSRILEELEETRNLMSDRRRVPRGTLRINLPVSLGKMFVVPHLCEFLERYPEIRLEANLDDRQVNLIEGTSDVALRIGTLDDSSLVSRRVAQQQVITIASPGYLKKRKIRTPDDLEKHRCVVFRMPTSGAARSWRFQMKGKQMELRPRPHLLLNEGEALVSAARSGAGIAQVPSYMAAEGIGCDQLTEVLPKFRPPPDPISAIYLTRQHQPARLRVFLDFLDELPELQNAHLLPGEAQPAGRTGGARKNG